MATLSSGLAAIWRTVRAAPIAATLWVAAALVVWNVILDRVIVVAGRRYVRAAALAAAGGGPYLRIDDWMRPAVTAGLWLASAAAGVMLILGWIAVRRSAVRSGPRP